MALKKNTGTKPSNVRKDRAPSWVNLSVTAKDGSAHSLGRGIPTNLDNKTLRSLHNAELANRAKYDEMVKALPKGADVPDYKALQFQFTGYVTITSADADTDLELF